MRSVAEAMVRGLTAALALPHEPIVDVTDIAARMRVKLVYCALPGDGRIDLEQRQPTVFLKSRASSQTHRFTLAHELCHLLLADSEVISSVRGFSIEPAVTERLCQAFAAELLMPRSWVRSQFKDAPICLYTVNQLSERADVSITAAHIRLAEVNGWKTTILSFDRDNSWLPLVIAGAPARSRGRIRLAPESEAVLDHAYRSFNEGERTAIVTLEIVVRGAKVTVPAELRKMAPGRLLGLMPLRVALGA